MGSNEFGFVVGCVWFAAFLLVHVAILHAVKRAKPTRLLLIVLLAAFAAAATNVAAVEPWGIGMAFAVVYALLTLACLFVVYAPFFYTVFTSLSVQSLVVIRNKGGEASIDHLIELYASPSLFEGRLNTMVASGYLVRSGGRFRLTPKAVLVGRIFRCLKSVWRLGAGG